MTYIGARLSLLVIIAVTSRSLWGFLHVPDLPIAAIVLIWGSLLILIETGAFRLPWLLLTMTVLAAAVLVSWWQGWPLYNSYLSWFSDWQLFFASFTQGQLDKMPAYVGYSVITLWVAALGSLALPARTARPYTGTLFTAVSALLLLEWMYNAKIVESTIWITAGSSLLWLVCQQGYKGSRTWMALISALLVLMVAWWLPKPSQADSRSTLDNRLQETAPLLAELRTRTTYQGEAAEPFQLGSTGFAEDESNLGGPVTLDPSPVLQITTDFPLPQALYLRGGVKTTYNSRGWINSSWQSDTLDLMQVNNSQYWRLRQETSNVSIPLRVELLQAGRTMFYPRPLHAVRLPYGHDLQNKPNGILMTQRVIPAGSEYTVWFHTDRQHQSEPALSPQEIRQLTELPRTLPQRVITLGDQLASGAAKPLDLARNIEKYLKNNFTYSLDIEPTPLNRDFVDYFLFDLDRGYCTYFASSMAVLLRSQGVPARWVTGFRTDTTQASLGSHGLSLTIRNMDAHAWVEAYIEPYGWLRFDPTPAGLPSMDTVLEEGDTEGASPELNDTDPAIDNELPDPLNLETSAQDGASAINIRTFIWTVLNWSLLGLLLLVAALSIVWSLHRQHARRQERLLQLGGRPAAQAGMWLLEKVGGNYGVPRRAYETPAEYSSRLAHQFPQLASELQSWSDWLEIQAYAGDSQLLIPDAKKGSELWQNLNQQWSQYSSVWRHEWKKYS